MPRYVLPTFNLIANIWRFGNPTTNPPDLQPVCNLAWGRRVFTGDLAVNPSSDSPPTITLLLPMGSNVFGDVNTGGSPDTAEVPQGSGWFYTVVYVDRIGCGFANEHLGAILSLKAPSPPPGTPAILMESSGYVLMEDGSHILLE